MRSPSRKRKKSVNTMMVKSKRNTATFFATDVTCATIRAPAVSMLERATAFQSIS